MNLADKIIQAKTNGYTGSCSKAAFFGIDLGLPDTDELGLPTSDTLDYFVARMIAYNYNKDTDGHMHIRDDGHIWKGNSWLAENTDNLYRIARWNKPIKPYQREAIWRRLREVLPRFSRDKYVLSDNLVWNRDKAELEEVNYKPNTII